MAPIVMEKDDAVDPESKSQTSLPPTVDAHRYEWLNERIDNAKRARWRSFENESRIISTLSSS